MKMKNVRAIQLLLWMFSLSAGAFAQAPGNVPSDLIAYPDAIYYNAKIVAMDDYTLSNSVGKSYQAMAVRGDRIQFLGDDREILAYAGPKTRKVDLKGHTVVPGIINTHTHLHDHAVAYWAKQNPAKVESITKNFSVTGKSFQEITKSIELIVKENMAHPLAGQWAIINLPAGGGGTGIGVDYLLKKGMSREQLDKLAPNLPVFIGAHPAFLMNKAARNDFLSYYEVPPTDENEKLAITIDTTIGRSLVLDHYFDNHLAELSDILEDGLTHQAAAGVTTFSSHIVGLRTTPAYMKLVRENRMPIRFGFAHRLCQQVEPDNPGCFLRMGDWAGLGDKYFWNVGLTLGGIDNGPPSFCSTMEAPPQFKSKEECILKPDNQYWKAVYTAFRSRYRYVVNHSYADKGVDYVMDIMEQVMKDNPDITLEWMRSLRVTADHCGFFPRPAQLPRMKRLNMIISCDDRYLNRSTPYLKIYGQDKAYWISPIKSMIAAGVMPTAETELRVESGSGPTLLAQYSRLIYRKNDRGESIAPEEAIDRATLLKMATIWPSYYVLKEKEIGSIEAGKLADFLVLNKDYFTIPEADIPTVFPLMTVVGGKTIVLRDEFAKDLGTSAVGPQINFRFKTDPFDFENDKGGD